MSEYDWPGFSEYSVVRIDPETRPYPALTPYRTLIGHWRAGTLPDPHTGALVEFSNGERTYRGELIGYDSDEDGCPTQIYVRMTHAPTHCGGRWGTGRMIRFVQHPGPRTRSLARGYTGSRPDGGAAQLITIEESP